MPHPTHEQQYYTLSSSREGEGAFKHLHTQFHTYSKHCTSTKRKRERASVTRQITNLAARARYRETQSRYLHCASELQSTATAYSPYRSVRGIYPSVRITSLQCGQLQYTVKRALYSKQHCTQRSITRESYGLTRVGPAPSYREREFNFARIGPTAPLRKSLSVAHGTSGAKSNPTSLSDTGKRTAAFSLLPSA